MLHHFPDELGVDDYLVRSTEFAFLEKPNGSVSTQVLQSGFKRIASPSPRYLKLSLPPLEFGYSVSPLDDLSHGRLPLQELDDANLSNLPGGIDGSSYRWIDLDGEGIAGVLTEQAEAWFYKPNLGEGQFGAVQCVATRPSLAALNRGRQQLLDLAGDGNLDLVDFASPTPGFFSRTEDAGWERFRSFIDLPNIDWQDPNLRFVDLTGDGHADLLVTDDQVFSSWHESHAEGGFGPARRVSLPIGEDLGPRLVFADGSQSIYLADMCGDGLTDLVRIRKSDVCYWPNIGYGRFGAKVTMSNVPWFDDESSFDQRRIHLFDTDGSGPTDIVYLGRDSIRVYLNQHGNSLSDARRLSQVPRADNLTSVSVVDFLGRGTACLLWSSPWPADARRPLRYLDLMGGVKPHLLTSVRNNLGAETRIEYASSTKFYLDDKKAGTPWATRLPFPVHVVTRVETRDLLSGNLFVTSSAYHDGYFDGTEREFRGFGRVDQWDTEAFGVLTASAAATPVTNAQATFHVPPTLTKTWFHTGAYRAGARISRHFEGQYYREGDSGQASSELSLAQREAMLLDDTVLPPGLSYDEAREGARSLKGAILRQEIYALDDTDAADRPYTVSERNYSIQPVQPAGGNRHSVFFTHARETIDWHYERKLFWVLNEQIVDAATAAANPTALRLADPRVTQSAVLAVDDYGNVRQSVAIAYGRRFDDPDLVLAEADRKKQKQVLVTLTEASFTNAVSLADAYRTPLPASVQTFELVKLRPASQRPDITNLFRFDELVALVAQAGDGAHDIPYEDLNATRAMGAGVYRRPIEELRTRYRSNNLSQLLPSRTLQALALQGESHKLALTTGLLNSVYQRPHAGLATESLLPNPGAVLIADSGTPSDRGGYVDLDGDGRWWVPSGRTFFHPSETATPADELVEGAGHFFVPRRFRDPFARSSFVDYASDLFPARTRDALGNTVEALHDYRALQARQLTDPNGNRSFAVFDALGLAVATAVRGKSSETLGDSLDDFGDFDSDPALARLQDFVADPAAAKAGLLKGATSRFVYDLDRYRRCGQPPFAATLLRESHVSDALPSGSVPIQVAFVYSDGIGRELQSKIQAEPGDAPARAANVALPGGDVGPGALTLSAGVPVPAVAKARWVGKGRTVYNNKGKPVKQYEPFFSSTPLYEPEPEMTDTGFTPILFYDPLERVVATLHPNHTYEKVVFDPWRQESWDVNDTVTQADPKLDPDVGDFFALLPEADYLPTWHEQRRNGQKGADEKAVAAKAAAHAATPAVAWFDTLGRPILTMADNGKDTQGAVQKYATRITLDIEGNQREVKDANNRVVMRYDYDMLGNRIHKSSMEAGQRWMLSDVTGKSIRAWDSRNHNLRIEYDELRRPLRSYVIGADVLDPSREIRFEETVFGETAGSWLTPAQMLQANLRGKPYKHFDTAGVVTSDAHDFKGNLLRSRRQLVADYKATPDWSHSPAPVLEKETFASSTRYDALNRPIQMVAPHSDAAGTKINVIRPGYNEANLLERVDVWLAQVAEPTTLLSAPTANLGAVTNIDYDAKGQRSRIAYGNGALTEYTYDHQTFRLIHLKTSRGAGSPGSAVFQDLFYTYDPAGNITHIREDAQQKIIFKGQIVAPQCDYVYDPTYRLISATGREHIGQLAQPKSSWSDEFRINLPLPGDVKAMRNYTEQYVYDAVDNFEKLIHQAANGNWTRDYAYNEASLIEPGKHSNRLSRTTVGSIAEPYTYDAHGNTTGMPHLTLMQWDFRDQLSASARQVVNATPPPGKLAETTFYGYDWGGQRVRKVTDRQNGSRKAERIYLGGFEIYREFDAAGSGVVLERETLHVMDDKRRIALVESKTQGNDGSLPELTRYQVGNHLGSVSLELDDKASVISCEEYTPYGSISYQALNQAVKATAKRYRYTGKERDEETGFGYHGSRYCAAWMARWISCDRTFNDGTCLYAYVRLNPVRLNDPSGADGDEGDQKPSAVSRFFEVGYARKAFLAGTFGLPFEPPTDPQDLKEWERGDRVAQLFALGEALSGGGHPSGTGGSSMHPAPAGGGGAPGAGAVRPGISLGGSGLLAAAKPEEKEKPPPAASSPPAEPVSSGPPPKPPVSERLYTPPQPSEPTSTPDPRAVEKPSFPPPPTKPAAPPKVDPSTPPGSRPSSGGSTGGGGGGGSGGSGGGGFGNWNLEDLMRGSSFKPTQTKVFRGTVEKMAQAMKDKKFDWAGMDDPIMLDASGNIVQGHHRVVAARLSRTPIPESAIHRTPGQPVREARPWGNVALKPGDKPRH